MKKLFLLFIILTTLINTGCWDMIEINERIYPYSVGVDLNKEGSTLFKVTFSYPNILALGKNPTQKQNVYVITTTGNSIFDATHKLTTRLQYPIYNKHLKVLVISEEIARNPRQVRELVDGLNRDFVVNKSVNLIVVPSTAEELLLGKLKAERQQVVEGTLYSFLVNRQDATSFTPRTIAEFVEDNDNRNVSVIPIAHMSGEDIEIGGGGVFKNYGLVGYLTHEENRALSILNGEVKQDGMETDFNGARLSVLGTSFKSKRKLVDSENLKIQMNVRIEGQVHEYTLADGDGIDSLEIIKAMEEALSKEVKKDLDSLVTKLQKEYKADAIKISDYLRKYHPRLWDQVKDNWDEVFSQATIDVNVNVIIRRRGLTK